MVVIYANVVFILRQRLVKLKKIKVFYEELARD